MAMCFALIFLYPSLNNGFVNWDDMTYVENNDLLKELSSQNISEIFTGLQHVGTYSPLTLLSWAIDYALAGLNPWMFHFTSLLLHLLNIFLVFVFVFKLFSRNDVAFFCALWFGVHPMNVEVVAWVSARKDVLYSFFFLLSLISYLNYQTKTEKKWQWYMLCLLLFSCSLLSKGMAITLPFLLLLIDYLSKRENLKRGVIEKVPFVLLAILFGVIGVFAQQDSGAMEGVSEVNYFEGLFVACRNVVFFFVKLFAPFGLSAFHPYPNAIGESLPWYYYLSPIVVIALLFLLFKWRKKNRVFVFGVLFFLITISPVIQFLPFGTAMVSERYAYMPYLGLYIVLGYGLLVSTKMNKISKGFKKLVLLLLAIITVGFGVLSHQRIKVWENGLTLWSDVIEKYPKEKVGYSNRSEYWRNSLEYDKAIKDMEMAIKYNPNFSKGYSLLAFLYLKLNENEKALSLLNKSIEIDDEFVGAYVNRAIAYTNLGRLDLALNDFNKVINNAEEHPNHYFNRANLLVQMGQSQKALPDFNKAIQIESNAPSFYRERARVLIMLGKPEEALSDLNQCVEFDNKDAECFYLRGSLYMNLGEYQRALSDLSLVVDKNPNHAKALLNKGVVNMNLKQHQDAYNDFNKCQQLDPTWLLLYLNRGLLYQQVKDYEKALNEYNSGIQLHPNAGILYFHRAKIYELKDEIEMEKSDLKKAQELGVNLSEKDLEKLQE